jgi:aminoglycoside phosphotransferase (APT) family kinase protein
MLLDRWVAKSVSLRLALPQVAPSVVAVDVTRKQVPFEFEVVEAVKGVCLKDFDEDESRTLRALASLGSLVARLHEQPLHGNGLLDTAPLAAFPESDPRGLHERWSDYVLLRLHEHIARCRVLGIVDEREGEWIDGEFRRASDWLDDVPAVLLHGDLGSHNVFVNGDDEASTLVDWEDALAGDPLYEIAFWATFHPQRRWAAFLEGYRRISNLPDDAGRRFWLYFLRIALAKTVVRDRFGLKDRPGRTPAVQRIRQAVDGLKRIGEGRSSLEAAIAARC